MPRLLKQYYQHNAAQLLVYVCATWPLWILRMRVGEGSRMGTGEIQENTCESTHGSGLLLPDVLQRLGYHTGRSP
jgi:hypothetical protein